MFCSKCGNKIEDNAKFCSSCGNAISDSANTENFYSAPANSYTTQSTPEPVQNPYAQPLYASARPSEAPVKNTKPNPFAFVSAGIMAVMLVLHFLPWFFAGDKTYSLFSYYISRMPVTEAPSIFYLILILGAMAFLIAGIITAIIRKNRIPMFFAIVSSALIYHTPIAYLLSVEAWRVSVTEVPFIIFALTFVNIAFAIPARIK